ncbi:uncharacterized protein TRIADDRAFT_55817 [Trichoplax adhaerens]|uniref:TPX2 C-terminal domain-containing protein n=1 Tax=Trichoplax adhaerens TaxID=10228 RepID=B3RVY1_TRIAD|nr:hypothetical protein TRIADDRAFT_55817 [Trichoplax adhaerens]EDV26078.1 hypothetical protein TRIADDRAFT_55817 [Trichoplax adhaerens]|eukprot:XP_002112111.1 hypothetical protein TRIADDRAFT_55817 [Trichoplax adhaerens]
MERMADCDIDPSYEYNAPKFIDFTQPSHDEESADLWFDNHIEDDDHKPFNSGFLEDEDSSNKENVSNVAEIANDNAEQPLTQAQEQDKKESTAQFIQEKEEAVEATPAEEDHAKTTQNQESTNFKSLWGCVVNDQQEVPSNLRTSWNIGSQQTDQSDKKPSPAVKKDLKRKIVKPVRRSVPNRIGTGASRNVTPKANSRRSDGPSRKPTSAKKKSTQLTVPNTPSFVRRSQVKRPLSESKKSTEEMQLERIANERKRIHELSKKNETFKTKALQASPYMPLRSSKELTQPVQLRFHTDQVLSKRKKEHSMTLRSDGNDVGELAAFDFARQLRKNTVASKNAPSVTGPKGVQPFTFATASRKRKAEEDADNQVQAPYIPMAELVNHYQNGTPKRFRGQSTPKQNSGQSEHHENQRARATCPKSPMLKTSQRSRSSREKVLSYKEMEEKEAEEIKKHKFKARPFDPKMFENSSTSGIKNKATACTTKPIGFKFHSDKRRSSNSEKSKENDEKEAECKRFKAQPIPAKILDGVTGVKRIEQVPLTIPQSPALMGKQRHAIYQQKLLEMPSEEPYIFKARPIPADNIELPEKKPISPTKPEPFAMPGLKVREEKLQKQQEKLEEEQKIEKESQNFKARPNVVTFNKPFEPRRSSKPLTDVTGFKLNTEERVEERQKFKEELKSKEEFKQMIEEQKKIELEERERKEVMALRKQMTHKANPVHHYKSVHLQGSDKPLTVPYSPNFAKRRSLRT